MLVLLDENLPHHLRWLIKGHDVRTVTDQGIRYQQNIQSRKIALVVLSNNERVIVTTQVDTIAEAINAAQAGSFTFVDIGY